MRARIRLIDETGAAVQTFDPYALALANGDPVAARVLMHWSALQLGSAPLPAGFRPAREFWPTLALPTYKKLLAFLKRHQEIRTRSCPRLEIYAPDWLRYGPKPSDIDWNSLNNLPAPVLDSLVAHCQELKRQAQTIRQSKSHN
jgi:hypothetical protein